MEVAIMPLFKSKEEKQKKREEKMAAARKRIEISNAKIAAANEKMARINAETDAKNAVIQIEIDKTKERIAEIDKHNKAVWNEVKSDLKQAMKDGREERRQIVSDAILEGRANREQNN